MTKKSRPDQGLNRLKEYTIGTSDMSFNAKAQEFSQQRRLEQNRAEQKIQGDVVSRKEILQFRQPTQPTQGGE